MKIFFIYFKNLINRNIVLLNIIPVLSFYAIIFPLYLLDSQFVIMPMINLLSTTFLIPAYLLNSNYKYIKLKQTHFFLVSLFLMVFSTLSSQFISYAFWGITTGNFYNPDGETVDIVELSIYISLTIVVLGGLLIQSIFLYKRFSGRSQEYVKEEQNGYGSGELRLEVQGLGGWLIVYSILRIWDLPFNLYLYISNHNFKIFSSYYFYSMLLHELIIVFLFFNYFLRKKLTLKLVIGFEIYSIFSQFIGHQLLNRNISYLTIIISVAWILYFLRSKRVENTFVL